MYKHIYKYKFINICTLALKDNKNQVTRITTEYKSWPKKTIKFT